MKPPVPVIMFHSIRPASLPWTSSFLSCDPGLFEYYLRYLRYRNYKTILLPDVMDYIAGKTALPERSVALTFDDGYLDNWTVAAPLLKKYGYCGTIFVNPEFVDERDVVRAQWPRGDSAVTRDHVDGMVSWSELKEAQTSGVFDVQSHTMTHSRYFTSGRIMDFHHPGDRYPWLGWNSKPERKPLWLSEDQTQFVDYGVPVYENARALIARRYFETGSISGGLSDFVRENGGAQFFEQADWRVKLQAFVSSEKLTGKYETESEFRARQDWELSASKEIISSKLGKPVDILCWPGGARDEYCCESARRIGYKGWTVAMTPNTAGRGGHEIGRISIPILKLGPADRMMNRLIFTYQLEGCRESRIWKHAKRTVRRLRWLSGRAKS